MEVRDQLPALEKISGHIPHLPVLVGECFCQRLLSGSPKPGQSTCGMEAHPPSLIPQRLAEARYRLRAREQAQPLSCLATHRPAGILEPGVKRGQKSRSEEHTSELQSHVNLVCRLLLEKKKEMGTQRRAWTDLDRDHSRCRRAGTHCE